MTSLVQKPSEALQSPSTLPQAVPPTPSGKMEYTDGTNWYSLATENFVLNNLIALKPCIAASTANLAANYVNGTAGTGATLTSISSGIFTLDGVTIPVGNRVLIKDQTSAFQNGIYNVTNSGGTTTSWVLTRAADYDTPSEMLRGGVVDIIGGVSNLVSSWMQTENITTIGTTNIIFARLSQNGIASIVGTANQILVTIVNNVATLSIAPNPVFPGTGSATLPGGTSAQRPITLVPGMIRFNNGS